MSEQNRPEAQIEYARPISQIVFDLSKPIPSSMLKTRRQGNADLTYIPWHEATRLLDYYAPGWNYTIEMKSIAGKVLCVATITIPAQERLVTRMASGYEDETTSSFGDPFSNAESMALRRAAAKFGLVRYLYK